MLELTTSVFYYSNENWPDDKWRPTWLLQFLENLDPGSSYHYFSALDRKIHNIRLDPHVWQWRILLQKHCIYLFMSFKGLHLYFMFFICMLNVVSNTKWRYSTFWGKQYLEIFNEKKPQKKPTFLYTKFCTLKKWQKISLYKQIILVLLEV